ncbi:MULTISPECIES: hypothetical protein [unclassified Streptomyces]|uniref:hypothetical protein n=1 Tax=unclassified Streptomyces TaxID=2593676 RepID=UPI002DDAC06E|nr:hypothetical protein [Streptomyces sp. NBC_01766]WSC24919.1 hypothetical protein OIE60_35210 [Streptomyces sp. NBC_01766]
MPSGVPVAGDGPGGDRAIQDVLDRSSPRDLEPALERRLVALATRVWKADVTGTGRSQWPAYFSDPSPPRAPYTHVRVQAAIARQGAGGRVRVDLVWAGAGPSGEAADGRPARVLLHKTDSTWEPLR